ncbi:MAG: molybdenum cofactor guanylyltransferase [Flavobacteriaceae bacterium]
MRDNKVYGLVLAGGKSTRMGKDKGAIVYHNRPQREHLYDLLQRVCDRTFYSIREDQVEEFSKLEECVVDKNIFKGPFNGMLSAHEQFPDVAWMVMACDMPFMDEQALRKLLEQSDEDYIATAFATQESGLPEPLAAIWEPQGLAGAIDYLRNSSSSCPRKYLINSHTKLVSPDRDQLVLNANSIEDYEHAVAKLTPR